jgi:hypothetical protein
VLTGPVYRAADASGDTRTVDRPGRIRGRRLALRTGGGQADSPRLGGWVSTELQEGNMDRAAGLTVCCARGLSAGFDGLVFVADVRLGAARHFQLTDWDPTALCGY